MVAAVAAAVAPATAVATAADGPRKQQGRGQRPQAEPGLHSPLPIHHRQT